MDSVTMCIIMIHLESLWGTVSVATPYLIIITNILMITMMTNLLMYPYLMPTPHNPYNMAFTPLMATP